MGMALQTPAGWMMLEIGAEPAQLMAAQHEALRMASHKETLTWTFAGVTLGGPATLLALGVLALRGVSDGSASPEGRWSWGLR